MKKVVLLLTVFLIGIVACKEEDEQVAAPVVTFSHEDGIYTVKAGTELLLEPEISNDVNALYSWKMDGKIVGTGKTYTFKSDVKGSYYLSFTVATDWGTAEKELRIDVAEKVPPVISLAVPENGYTLLVDNDLTLRPEFTSSGNVECTWKVNGSVVSSGAEYVFSASETGEYHVELVAVNEDGESRLSFTITVCTPEDMPFSWMFERVEYSMSSGRTIRLLPYAIRNAFDAVYTWTVDGEEKQSSSNPLFAFPGTERTEPYVVVVTMENSYATISQELKVYVCGEEGTYQRKPNAASSEGWNKVYEFLPAPGQFVNEDYMATTMEEACAYAEDRLKKQAYVSLGGFGGYLVVGFDHSIENDGGYNIQIYGNSFSDSSEPGIVWVMQDENGNGLPDDTWYELKGSEYDNPETIQDYEVTYYRPSGIQQSVSWTDSQGKSGFIDYLIAYHNQDYYYPNWVEAGSYVLRGTCLPAKTREVTPGYWSNDEYEWGYADNFSPIDRLTDDDNYNAGANANHFKISNAVTFDGKPANLKYVDFVKIQTGVNVKAGWLGETSTEVFDVKDFNLIKNK